MKPVCLRHLRGMQPEPPSARRGAARAPLALALAVLAVTLPACSSASRPALSKRLLIAWPPSASPLPVVAAARSGPAPMIVQVENSQFARPQSGLSDATIVYEYVAEGGVSRFSAIFAQPPPVRIGPVRSARLATIQLLGLYGGVLVYSGASHYIFGQLVASHRPSFNEGSAAGNLFRVGSRSPPHNLYTDGNHLLNLRGRSRAAPISFAYFAPAAPPATGARPAVGFTVPVSTSEAPHWRWDAQLRGWTRSEPDTGLCTDANSGAPLVATTVIVQQVHIAISPNVVDVNGVHGVSHTLTGTGAAQVFVGGNEYDASWSQPASGPPQFTLAGGQSAPIAPGLVWIELVATGSPARLG